MSGRFDHRAATSVSVSLSLGMSKGVAVKATPSVLSTSSWACPSMNTSSNTLNLLLVVGVRNVG